MGDDVKPGRRKGRDRGDPPRTLKHRLTGIGRSRLAFGILAFVAVWGLLAVGIYALYFAGDGSPEPKTAAIVDQLSLTVPNPDFVKNAGKTLKDAGYTVDYYPGEEVTVDLYRGLPQPGYDVIIMRVHAGITREVDSEGTATDTEYVSLFTGEPYDETLYPDELSQGRLGKAEYFEGAEPLFGISPDFVTSSMSGEFDGAVIIMMGCDGLRTTRTAEAFLGRGAQTFVSWSQPVTADHTDAATERLLHYLLSEGLPTEEAVSRTMGDVGPDPLLGAELRFLNQGG